MAKPGFFIPYRYHDSVHPISYPSCHAVLSRKLASFGNWIEIIESFGAAFARFGGAAPSPRFEQDWFARLDLMACYAIVRQEAPRRIIEVGSGHSTRVMCRAIADSGNPCELTCIDPSPRATIKALPIQHISKLVNEADDALFDQLQSGDILFVDSSHLAQPGTDVDYLFNVIIPRLPRGVLIHIHDIFLPDAYPEVWRWRGYNEQLLVAGMITSGSYSALFASHFILQHTSLISNGSIIGCAPLKPGALETSMWLRKMSCEIR